MEAVFLLVLILFGGFWGSVLLYTIIKGISRRLGVAEAEEGGSTALFREEVDSLARRLERVEEELEFYKALKAPDGEASPRSLQAPEEPEA